MVLIMRAIRAAAGASSASARKFNAVRSILSQARFSTQSSVYTWGSGSLGQLGHGAFVKSGMRSAYEELSPKLVEAFVGKSIVKLEFGATHSAAIDDKGRVYMWGSNEYNKLGLGPGTGDFESLPRLMDAFEGIEIVNISCGDYYTAAVDKDGKMYSWGWGGSTMKGAGGLGHAGGKDEPTPRLLRSLVDQGVPIASVECGEFHTVALSKDGEIWAWGNGEYGRLGNGETDTFEVPEPIEFFADENVVSISAGRDFTFALTDNGELYGWGGNSHNQLGVGGGLTMDHYNMEAIPTLVEGFNGVSVKQFAAGYDHAAAVTDDGRLYMWGSKLWLEPHEMTALEGEKIVQVACGRVYTVALSEDGKVFTFGKGSSNCLGHGDRKNQLQPLQIQSLANISVVSVQHDPPPSQPESRTKSPSPQNEHIAAADPAAGSADRRYRVHCRAPRVRACRPRDLVQHRAPSSPELRFEVHQEAGGVAETTRPKRVRGAHSDDLLARVAWRPGRGDSVAAVLGGKMRKIWHQVSELLEDFSASSKSYFGSSNSTKSPGVGLYDMWTNEDDTSHEDSDACAKLYRDNKQHQVCIISI